MDIFTSIHYLISQAGCYRFYYILEYCLSFQVISLLSGINLISFFCV